MLRSLFLTFCAFCPTPASADFVLNNLRFTLYHEVGHAVIDQHRIPIFGPEENAADTFGLILAERILDETQLRELIQDITRLGRVEAAEELFDPWAEYMPSAQRTARTICIWYGLNPDLRGDLARALGMPPTEERLCIDSARAIRKSWTDVIAKVAPVSPQADPTLVPKGRGKALNLLAKDIDRVNGEIALVRETPLMVEHCGENNAFYYHYDDRMVICDEMVVSLRARAAQ